VGAHAGVQRVLAGVPERRVSEIVRQGDRFGQILFEPKVARDRAPELRDFQAMREPRAKKIAFVVDEDLRLVLQLPEGAAVDDPVPVSLERGATRMFLFRERAAARLRSQVPWNQIPS